MVTLKPKDFRKSAHFSPSFISNGHWIVRRSYVENQALYVTEEGTRAALKVKPGDNYRVTARGDETLSRVWPAEDAVLSPWTVSPFTFGGTDAQWRILTAGDGQGIAVLDDAYLELFEVERGDVLYRVQARDTFFNRPSADDATFGLISGRNHDMVTGALRAIMSALPVLPAVEPVAEPAEPVQPAGGTHE